MTHFRSHTALQWSTKAAARSRLPCSIGRMQICQFMFKMQRTHNSSASMLPTLDPGADHDVAIFVEITIIYRRLKVQRFHCPKLMRVQIQTVLRYTLQNGIPGPIGWWAREGVGGETIDSFTVKTKRVGEKKKKKQESQMTTTRNWWAVKTSKLDRSHQESWHECQHVTVNPEVKNVIQSLAVNMLQASCESEGKLQMMLQDMKDCILSMMSTWTKIRHIYPSARSHIQYGEVFPALKEATGTI